MHAPANRFFAYRFTYHRFTYQGKPIYHGDMVELSRQRVNVRQGRYRGTKGTLVGYIDARRTTACVVRLDDGRDVVIGATQVDIY